MLSLVIPCYRERQNVERFEEELFPPLERLGRPYEVIAVDDGSDDGTAQALERLRTRELLSVVSHSVNRGMGAALRSGFERAKGEWIATLDADLTFSPRDIPALLERQRQTNADLVAGSPFLAADGLRGVPLSRRLPSVALNAFYRGLFRHDFTGYTPIFRLYRARGLKSLELKSSGFEINAEIAARFIRGGYRVAETPAALSLRIAGESKLSRWRELQRHAALIARLLIR